ncbi:MAG: precorrin-8X methylmutase [Leptospirillum sp.]|nr:precorrin-8X methylmutase [Nitrospiraceae bacterium]
MKPAVVVLSQIRRNHLEGIRNQLSRHGGHPVSAAIALEEGIAPVQDFLETLSRTGISQLAVLTMDEDAARVIESFDRMIADIKPEHLDIRHIFGFIDTQPFIRAMSEKVRRTFAPSEEDLRPVILLPEKIEEESFRIIDETLSGYGLESRWHQVVRRAIHAAADYEMADIMDAHEKALDSIVQALSGGCRIIVDVQMVESGLSKPHLSANGNTVFCHVSDPDVRDEATRLGLTRSTMAMRKAKQAMEGAVVVVGNAPTALFEVVRLIREEGVRPAGIVGVPVGFVGASESKELLSRVSEVPWIVTRGPKGGSTVAVAITNALLRLGKVK